MGFLKPLFLFGLALASIPVIIHFFHRRRLKRVDFSSLFFLRDLKHERFSWLRLRELLLLVARTLLLVFLFFALAHPFLRSGIFLGKRTASVALILDDSYSMGFRLGSAGFERGQREARALLGQLGSGSEVSVGVASQPDHVGQPKRNLAAVRTGIDSLSPSFRSPDLKPAVEKALAGLEESVLAAREVFVFTDLQRSALRQLLTAPLPKDIPVYLVDAGVNGAENAGVVGVELSNPLPSREEPTKIVARLKNYSERELVKRVKLAVNNDIVERTEKLAPKEEKKVLFDKILTAPGSYAGSVEIDSDSLAADDRRFFAFDVPETIPVLLVYENPNDIIYLKTALAPTPAGNFSVETTELANLKRVELGRFKVVALINPVHLTMSDWQRIDLYLEQGGGVFIDLGDEIADPTWLAPFAVFEVSSTSAGFVSLSDVDFSHPIFQVFQKNVDPTIPKFYRIAKVKPAHSSVVARFADSNPFLLEAAERRLIIATAVFNLDRTDLPLKTMFLPFVHRTFVYLAQAMLKSNYQVGDTIVLPASQSSPWTVVTPEQTTRILPEIKGGQRIVHFDRTEVPGIYRLGDDVLSVNVVPDEGDLSRVTTGELRRAGLVLLTSARGHRVDLTQLLLYLALFCLITEMVLIVIPQLPGWGWFLRLTRLGRKR